MEIDEYNTIIYSDSLKMVLIGILFTVFIVLFIIILKYRKNRTRVKNKEEKNNSNNELNVKSNNNS